MNRAQQSSYASLEEEMLSLWAKEGTFEASVKQREGQTAYVFNDGPPFANGQPHFGHSLVNSIKDSYLRYKTMRGYYVPRRNGWDCHGLPVEFSIEKEFGISGKKQILELGIDKFNEACRASIFRYKDDWEAFMKRIGRWSSYDEYYATVDRDYTESVWWVMKQIHNKDLLYRGYKSMPYCPRCETPLSNFEVNEGYKDNVPDPSLFVEFRLKEEDAYLLAWTTTPWSLPGNAALAVNPEADYVYVEFTDEDNKLKTIILAKSRLSVLDEDTYKIVKEVKGSELAGLSYEPLFKLDGLTGKPNHQNLYKVWTAPFVSIEDGSGVLHVAPAFGEDDLSLAQEQSIPVLNTISPSGRVEGGIGFDEVKDVFFKNADKSIIEHLTKQGNVFAAETIKHTYPFCERCGSPLLYYAISSWFIRVSAIRDQLVKSAEDINWVPNHIKSGRFGKWLEGARDWAVSRNRYWGAPMPVWANVDDPDDYIVVGSLDELKKLAGDNVKVDDLHRPLIDDIEFSKDGKTYRRIEEVIDCWFESGSMPVAQWHYPFENEDRVKSQLEADFIVEGLDQTHLWFYVQHVISTILFSKPAFKNVIVNGIITAADGQKLSKRLKNYPPIEDVFNTEGADSLRLYLLSNTQAIQVADYMRFDRRGLLDVQRNILGTLQNSVRFFKLYTDIDKWQPPTSLTEPKSTNVLDEWIIERVNETVAETTEMADNYKIAHAIEPIFRLIDDTSNWYIRRSRRRFWKSEDDQDKLQAYETLYYSLVKTVQLLSPWAPFVSDKIYRDLTSATKLPKSVHLTDWPEAHKPGSEILDAMAKARDYINQGLALRADAGIKIRQPLASTSVPAIAKQYLSIIADELNVKEVRFVNGDNIVELDTTITDELKQEGLSRELIRQIQSARKKADFKVEDRISLSLDSTSSVIKEVFENHADAIKQETLALDYKIGQLDKADYSDEVDIEGEKVKLSMTVVKS